MTPSPSTIQVSVVCVVEAFRSTRYADRNVMYAMYPAANSAQPSGTHL